MASVLSPVVEAAAQTVSACTRLNLLLMRSFLRDLAGVRQRQLAHSEISVADCRPEIVRLLRLFRSELQPQQLPALLDLLNGISQKSTQIQRALVVWLDLMETLVQDAEQRHEGGEKLGQLKKSEVKSALKYLFRQQSLPKLPAALTPPLLDLIIDLMIDEIVLLTNRYGLWQSGPEPTVSGRIADAISKHARNLALGAVRVLSRIVDFFEGRLSPRPILSPRLESALQAVQREGMIFGPQSVASGVIETIIYMGQHRREILRISELVFGAVQEAEVVLHLDGQGKKGYARNLIWAVLEEAGFAPRPGLLSAIIDSWIDLLIDTSVRIFNKRGVFRHQYT